WGTADAGTPGTRPTERAARHRKPAPLTGRLRRAVGDTWAVPTRRARHRRRRRSPGRTRRARTRTTSAPTTRPSPVGSRCPTRTRTTARTDLAQRRVASLLLGGQGLSTRARGEPGWACARR